MIELNLKNNLFKVGITHTLPVFDEIRSERESYTMLL